MAYPEPVPVLKGKEAEEFDRKLKNFKLTGAQKELYREARKNFPPEKS